MVYIVLDSCAKCKYTDCVEVCPTDAFREGPEQLVICPNTCISCGACELECPVEAIRADVNLSASYLPQIHFNQQKAAIWPSIREHKRSRSF